MRLYCSSDPHSWIVRVCLIEKNLTPDLEVIVTGGGETRRAAHLARNPFGQLPVLETDDGIFISETTVICEYLEELCPDPPLIGQTRAQRAECRMWMRRIDLNICVPIDHGFRLTRHGSLLFPPVEPAPDAAKTMRDLARTNLTWLDQQLRGRETVCPDRFTLADVLLLSFVEHGITTGQPLDPRWSGIERWLIRSRQRPSVREAIGPLAEPAQLSGTV